MVQCSSTGEKNKVEETHMTVSKSTLQEFYAMTMEQKKEFVTFLRRELRLEEERKEIPSNPQEADKRDS